MWAKVKLDHLVWLELGKKLPETSNEPVPSPIVEAAVHESMKVIITNFQRAECAVWVGDLVAQDPVEPFSCGEEVVKHSEQEAGVI